MGDDPISRLTTVQLQPTKHHLGGRHDNRDQLAEFSNFGVNSVDVAAPGVDIASSAYGSYYYSVELLWRHRT